MQHNLIHLAQIHSARSIQSRHPVFVRTPLTVLATAFVAVFCTIIVITLVTIFATATSTIATTFAPSTARAQANITGAITGTTDTVTLTVAGTLSGTFFSSAGAYSLTSFPNGSYTITPSLAGFTFSPTSRMITLSGTSVLNADFAATAVGGATITGFTPTTGSTGTTITITGTNFTGTSQVQFGGVTAASFVVNSPTQISATVSSTGASGAVSVTTPLGTALALGFTFTTATVSMSSTATTPPVISPIASQTIVVNSSTAVIPFLVSDVETPAAQLTVLGTSDNQDLLPNANILFSGNTTVRGVRLVPLPNVTGTAVVTIGVFDGALITTTTFTLTVTAPMAPVITSFSPQSAPQLSSVTIIGRNFSANNPSTTQVSFGGVPAALVTVLNDTLITAVVGNGASGNVTVTTSGGTASAAGFTYLAPAPQISGFLPARATTGTAVIIYGQNFVSVTSVTLGGTLPQSYIVNSPTQITAIVGAGSSGAVRVATASGGASELGFVFVAPPAVSGFSPAVGAIGTQVSIFGFGFLTARTVRFGGVLATSFRIVSDTRIDAVLGAGASGVISITNEGGTASSASAFTVISGGGGSIVVSGFSPTTQVPDSAITIFGVGFTGTTAVSIGGTAAARFDVLSDTQINAIVGRLAQSGAVVVTSPLGIAQGNGFVLGVVGMTMSGAPLVSAIADQTIVQTIVGGVTTTQPLTIPFNVSGGAVPAAFLQVSASSNNAALVPQSGLALGVGNGGVGSVRTLTIQPSALQTGRALITLGVTDGVRASTTTFALTVLPPAIPAPALTSFSPNAAGTGEALTLVGTGLRGVSSVTLGGVVAQILSLSDTQIIVFVGSGASGEVRVAASTGSSALTGFVYLPTLSPPVLTGFSPTLVVTSGTVAVSGRGFTGATQVTFGGVPAQILSLSDERIVALVSAGASGEVRVFTPRGASGLNGFTFVPAGRNLPPSISPIANQTAVLPTTTVGPILFAVDDLNQPAANLQVFAASSNPLLLPNQGIVLGGGSSAGVGGVGSIGSSAGSLRSLTLLTTPGQTGTATVTVVVFNGILTSSTQFQLTVSRISSVSANANANANASTDEPQRLTRLAVFPNPATDNVTLSVELNEASTVAIRVVNMLGETVLTHREAAPQGTFRTQLDLSAVPTGVYALEISTRGQRWTQRIVRGR
jgi:hypothetical protein